MKKQILVLCLMVSTMTFIRAQDNLSDGLVQTFGGGNPSPISIPGSTINEIFRFLPGLVTQGTSFGFADKWFALGELDFGQSFYGLRFQDELRGLTMGYVDGRRQPRIQWIHDGSVSTAGNLEFRVGSGFGSAGGGPGQNTLVASMSPFAANTYFGTDIDVLNPFGDNSITSPKVGIETFGQPGLSIRNINTSFVTNEVIGARINVSHVSEFGYGIFSECADGEKSTGVLGKANGESVSIGVRGETTGNARFGAAIYGEAGVSGADNFAGFFDGDIFQVGNGFITSDEKLKTDVTNENNILEKISLLRPVAYTFIKTEGLMLPKVNQHGFISQELAEVFPELTRDLTKPVFNEDGEIVSDLSYKAVNYVGLISVLTAGIQELNTELIEEITSVREELSSVREELAEYKANDKIRLMFNV